MRLSEANEAIYYSRDRARKNCVHCNFLGNDIQLNTDLILSERHVDEDISDENQHDAQNCERQSFRVVVEVLRYVHVVKPNEGIEVLFFDLDVPQLSDLHHQLHFLLVPQSLVHQDVLNVLFLGVDLEVILIVSGGTVIWSLLLNHVLFSLHHLLILKLLLGRWWEIHTTCLLLSLLILRAHNLWV